MVWQPDGEESLRIYSAVSTEYRRVTDGQTDGRTDRRLAAAYASSSKIVSWPYFYVS